MGDSIVNFVVADLIFRNFPNRQEGDMTKIRASLVRGESLAKHARALHLGDYILLSHGLQLNGGSDSSKVLENVFEAFMGATYMDQGFDFTYQLLRSLFIVDIQILMNRPWWIIKPVYKKKCKWIVEVWCNIKLWNNRDLLMPLSL